MICHWLTVLACDCPKLIAPAMNIKCGTISITEDNIKKAREYGFEIIEPDKADLHAVHVATDDCEPEEI